MTCQPDGRKAEIVYVTTENFLLHVYYECQGDSVVKKLTFKIDRPEEGHHGIVLKTRMKCRLRNYQDNEGYEQSRYLKNMQPYAEPEDTRHMGIKRNKSALHFELYFTYVCRFYSPLKILERAGYANTLQSQQFKISLGGYMELDGDRPLIGLVYNVAHWPQSNPQNDPKFSFYNQEEK